MRFRRLCSLFLLAPACSLSLSQAQEAAATDQAAEGSPAEEEVLTADGEVSEETEDDGKNFVSKNVNLSWNNAKGLEQRLGSQLMSAVKSLEPEKVQAFVRKGKNRLLLAQYMMVVADQSVTSEDAAKAKQAFTDRFNEAQKKLAELKVAKPGMRREEREAHKSALAEAEAQVAKTKEAADVPFTMAEFAAQKDKDSKKLLTAVCGNEQWMEDLVLSGTCKAPGRAMAVLASIAQQHPEIYKEEMPRKIATACAAEWAKSGYPFEKAAPRADYFIRHTADQKLNPVFDTIPMNIRRVVLGGMCPSDEGATTFMGNNRAGEVPSMEWALENVHLPEERYTGCCWRAGYKLFNVYGASIHTGDYFLPFDGMYDKNHHQFTAEVGGVCGGLSHFGAYAAIANGVPALTMGEPGHCAFMVLIRGKWTNAYSVDWHHSPHFTPWDKCWLYQSIFMMTEMYSPAEREATYVSDTYRALARIMVNRKRDKDALRCFRYAVSAQPLSFSAWREYAAYLKEKHAADEKLWMQLNDDICLMLTPRYPEMAGSVLHDYVYPALQTCAKDRNNLLAAIHMYWDNTRRIGPSRWHFDNVLSDQMMMLSPSKPDMSKTGKDRTEVTDGSIIMEVFAIAMADTALKSDWAPLMVEWGNTVAATATGGNVAQDMVSFTTEQMTHAGGADRNSGDMMGNLIRTAGKAKDINAFQKLAKDLAEAKGRTKKTIPDYEKPAGELRSTGGVLYTGKYDKDDDAAGHWGVLEECGGSLKTAALKDAWVAMKFARDSYISGVVVITADGGEANDNLQLQASETGEAGSWTDVGLNLGKSKDRVHLFNLNGQEFKSKYLRVIRKGGDKPLHINAFHIYGRKAA